MSPNLPLIAWAPDADPTTPGVMVDVQNLLPTDRGYAPNHALAQAIGVSNNNLSPLPSRCYGAALLAFETNTPVIVAGAGTQLFRIFAETSYDVSRVGGYTAVPNPGRNHWVFAAFGNAALALKNDTPLQATTNIFGSNFADVAGAPGGGASMAVQANFVIVAGYSPAWPYRDGWWCSALGDYTDWTPDVATQCAQGRLTQTPGEILRVIAFQNDLIFFKATSIIRGTYVGTPSVWAFSVISTDIGLAGGHDSVVQVGGVLYWVGPDGFYSFNGASIQKIRSAPWTWLLEEIETFVLASLMQGHWDPSRKVIRWYYAPRLSNELTGGIAYHIDTDRWGRFSAPVDWATSSLFEYSPTSTDGRLNNLVLSAAVVINSATRTVMNFRGEPLESSFTTGDFGDDDNVTAIMGARVRYLSGPSSSNMTHYHRMNSSDGLTTGETVARTDGKYNVSHSARWHRAKFTQNGRYEAVGFSVLPAKAGKR
jgi:hypothetical protein